MNTGQAKVKQTFEKAKKTDYQDAHKTFKNFAGKTGEFMKNSSQKMSENAKKASEKAQKNYQ